MNKLAKTKEIAKLIRLAIKTRKSGSAGQYELYDRLISMGGLYVKFVQLLLLKLNGDRRHLAQEFSFLLRKAYDSTPFEPINIKGLLRAELGEKIEEFESIDPTPVAAGSFGQVYRAKLKDGSTVAVKALRPSVLNSIHFDMKILGILARLVNFGNKNAYDVSHIFSRFRFTTLQELNYPKEAHYANEVYAAHKDHDTVVIPKTYMELCTKHLIVQEYIEGITLAEVLAQKEFGFKPAEYVSMIMGSDLNKQMIAIGQLMLESMLVEGTAHGDPHPGNIMVLPNDKVAILDFGISAQVPSDKKAFFDLVKQYQKIYTGSFDLQGYTWAIINLFVKDLTMAVRSLDMYNKGRISDQLFLAITESALSIYGSSGSKIDELINNNKFLKIFNAVINEDNRFGFNIEIEQPEFMRATLMFVSLVEALEVKHQVLATVYTNVVNNFSGTEFDTAQDYTSPEDAVAIIAEWLEKVASKDIYLYQMLSSKISSRGLRV